MTWTTKKDLIDALDEMSKMITTQSYWYTDEMSEHIGKLRSLVDHLPEQSED